MLDEPFWRTKSLSEMSHDEWESLCDGCGKCCLLKLEDEDSGEIEHTDVACHLLDLGTCRCGNYPKRRQIVPDCVILTPKTIEELRWMPTTCAYRLINEGKDLPWWHPLISGEAASVARAGISVEGRAVSETEVEDADLEDHVVTWAR